MGRGLTQTCQVIFLADPRHNPILSALSFSSMTFKSKSHSSIKNGCVRVWLSLKSGLQSSELVFTATALCVRGRTAHVLGTIPPPSAAAAWNPPHFTRQREEQLRRGGRPVRLSLCDFSQSRLLINFRIVNVKVRLTPFHSGADKTSPHQHSCQWLQVRLDLFQSPPLPPPPPPPRQFRSRRKSMPSKSASRTAGGRLAS